MEHSKNQKEKKRSPRSQPFAFKGATVHKTSTSDSEFKPILQQHSEQDSSSKKLKNKEKISAKHFSKHDYTETERTAYSSRIEEERIEEILMTQKNSNKLPVDNFVAGLHQINNNDYAAEPVQVEKKEENLNDSFEEDEYVEEDDEDEDDEDGGSSKNQRISALQKNYYIRIQVPSSQMSDSINKDGNNDENIKSSSVEKSYMFTLFSKYSGISTCHIYGENGR